MRINEFDHTITVWIQALQDYSLSQLCQKPDVESWSMGQVYRHLIDDTRFYMDQIRICLSNDDHKDESASPAAKKMFGDHTFPDLRLKGPDTNPGPAQPENREALLQDMVRLKNEMKQLEELIPQSPFQGKTQHPGFHYFSAYEWLKFAEMHLRHHLKQKARIDQFLQQGGAPSVLPIG